MYVVSKLGSREEEKLVIKEFNKIQNVYTIINFNDYSEIFINITKYKKYKVIGNKDRNLVLVELDNNKEYVLHQNISTYKDFMLDTNNFKKNNFKTIAKKYKKSKLHLCLNDNLNIGYIKENDIDKIKYYEIMHGQYENFKYDKHFNTIENGYYNVIEKDIAENFKIEDSIMYNGDIYYIVKEEESTGYVVYLVEYDDTAVKADVVFDISLQMDILNMSKKDIDTTIYLNDEDETEIVFKFYSKKYKDTYYIFKDRNSVRRFANIIDNNDDDIGVEYVVDIFIAQELWYELNKETGFKTIIFCLRNECPCFLIGVKKDKNKYKVYTKEDEAEYITCYDYELKKGKHIYTENKNENMSFEELEKNIYS